MAYVAGRLNGYGYTVTVNPKQDWTVSDIPTAGQMAAYLRDVAALRGAIAVMASTPPTPDSASELTWREANDIDLTGRGRAADPHGGGVVLFRRLVRRGSVKE